MEYLPNPNETYKKFNKNKYKTFTIKDVSLHPIADIKTVYPINFSQETSNYTTKGREKIYQSLPSTILTEMQKMIDEHKTGQSIEYLDNRISKFSMQNGKCAITGIYLTAETMHCHHIIPKHLGGTDKFDNLIIIDVFAHKLIHATKPKTISKYLHLLKLNQKQLKKLNKLRSTCNLETI